MDEENVILYNEKSTLQTIGQNYVTNLNSKFAIGFILKATIDNIILKTQSNFGMKTFAKSIISKSINPGN